MSEAKHSTWSASGFEQVMLCPGSKPMQNGLPNPASKHAAEGTVYHQVLTWALQDDRPAAAYIGRVVEADGFSFEIDEENAAHVQTTIDYVHDLAGDNGVILVDIRVNYSTYLGVDESEGWGTADVIVLRGEEIIVVDLKFGRGVEVSAEKNPQMSLYALGALAGYNGVVGEFTHVRVAISQPRITNSPSEYDLTVEQLEAWGRSTARSAVATCRNAIDGHVGPDHGATWEQVYLRPGEKQCRWCRAKATCPALRNDVANTLGVGEPATPEDFNDIEVIAPAENTSPWLSACLGKVDLIEDWCKAVRAEVERRMLAGETVPGYKLVEGKQGNRAWSDEKAAETLLKSMRLKQEELYDFSVKSPTQIAKLGPAFDKDGKVKPIKEGAEPPTIGPRQWPRVAALITRAPPKKHVAPLSDPRPALAVTAVVDDFDTVTADTNLDDLA